MSPVTVFFRTLTRSSAIFFGAAAIFLHPSLEWRGESRTTVGALQAPREAAVDGLISALKDTDATVRREAVAALAELKNPRAAGPIAVLLTDSDAAVRATAANALAELDDATAIDPLMAALSDKSPSVRRAVVNALGELHATKALDALTRALKDEDVAVRRAAASAIAEIGDDDGTVSGPHLHPHPHPHPHPNPHPMLSGFGGARP
jgi:HEAT repeat protein